MGGKNYFRVTATIGKNPDGSRMRKQFLGASKKEAEQKGDEFLENLKNGLNLNFEAMTLSELMKIWLFRIVKTNASDNTFDRYESVYRNYVASSNLAFLKVFKIERMHLQNHYSQMSEDNFTYSQIFNLNKLLKMFFNYALDEGYIRKNPCIRLIIPKATKSEDEPENIDPFTNDEVRRISEKASSSMKILFLMGLATGMRRGELLGLRVKDVNLDSGLINVQMALKKVKKFDSTGGHQRVTILEPPKTKTSIRSVPIPSALIENLRQHLLSEEEKHLKLSESFSSESLFFTSETCTAFDGKNIGTAWKRLLKRVEVRYRSFHNIRHTYATRLFEARVPLITISRLLGHANTNITANIYISVMPKEKESAAEELNYLFQFE